MCFAQNTADDDPITLDLAIQRTLERNPRITVNRLQVDQAQGQLTAAAGAFDWTATSSAGVDRSQAPYMDTTAQVLAKTDSRTDTASAGLGRVFRNSVGVQLTQTYSSWREKYYDPFGTVATMNWALTVTVPLLRGAGTADATANERSLEETLAATRYSSAYAIIGEIFNTAELYWSSLAQQQNIATLDAMMVRARGTAEILAERLKGGELAEVEYKRSLAELRLRESDFEDGRQQYVATQEKLAAQLGGKTNGKRMVVVGAFPVPPAVGGLDRLRLESLIGLALDRRLDRKALEKNQSSARIVLDRSENDLLPQLDLKLIGQYTAAEAHYDASRVRDLYMAPHQVGPSATGMLTLTMPLANDAAKGAVTSNQAAVSQYRMQLSDLDNSLRSDVAIALDKLRTHSKNYWRAKEATTMLEDVATETTRKLAMGESSMTDVLSVESRLLDSRLRVIQISQNYAQALAELRLATGTLANGEGDNLTVEWRMLTSVPDLL